MPVVPVVPNGEPLDCAEVVGLLEKSEGALELVWPAFENMILGGMGETSSASAGVGIYSVVAVSSK